MDDQEPERQEFHESKVVQNRATFAKRHQAILSKSLGLIQLAQNWDNRVANSSSQCLEFCLAPSSDYPDCLLDIYVPRAPAGSSNLFIRFAQQLHVKPKFCGTKFAFYTRFYSDFISQTTMGNRQSKAAKPDQPSKNSCEPERWDQVKRVDESVFSVSLGLCGVIYMSIEPRVM